MSGTVKEFQWVNSHAWIMLTVADPEGCPALWAIEMGGPGQLARVGWNASTLAPDMDVKVAIHPLRDSSNGGPYVARSRMARSWQSVTALHGARRQSDD